MTSQEYDRSRLEALPIAIQIIESTRAKNTTNPPAWTKLQHAGTRLGEQLTKEFTAYFTPEPFAPKTAILKAHAEAQGIPCVEVSPAELR